MTNYQPNFQSSDDPLGEALYQLRLDGSLYARSYLTAPWAVNMPALPGKMMFHIVTKGQCLLQIDGDSPILMRQGSLVLVPHGRGHKLMDAVDSDARDLFELPIQKISDRYEIIEYGGGGSETEVTCCVMGFDEPSGRLLIEQLPEYLHIDRWENEIDSWLQTTLEFIAREARVEKLGGQTIITHLADILMIQAIRSWVSKNESPTGWVAAIKDKFIGQALNLMHNAPGKNWTVDILAKEVGLSRSGFSARFTYIVGEPAKAYLTRWRMQVARSKLLTERISLGQLAEQLGYQSEAAFSRAFKRVMDESPGQVKKLGLDSIG